METKYCQYKNCNCPITWKCRKDTKFCSNECRKHYWTYEKRELEKVKEKRNLYENLMKEYIWATECKDMELVELYNQIKNK